MREIYGSDSRDPSQMTAKLHTDIVGCGECMVEFFRADDSEDVFQRSFGGDVINTLAIAARLGSSVQFVSRIGDDLWAGYLRSSLNDLTIGLHATSTSGGF